MEYREDEYLMISGIQQRYLRGDLDRYSPFLWK